MAQQPTAEARPGFDCTTTSTSVTRMICHFDDTYDSIIQRFRVQVPQLDISRLRTATSDKDIKQALEDAKSSSGFVLFAEYNHAGWTRHFATQEKPIQRAHRFTFGNPLYALPILQQDIQAALRIPLDCCFIEELDDKQTKMTVDLPVDLLGPTDHNGDGVRQAVAELQAKVLSLVESLKPQV